MLGTVLQLVSIVLTASLIVFLYIFKRGLPDFGQVFDNLGGDISKAMSDIVEKPVVKASMSQLGKKSGEVRASAALRDKVAEKALGQNILLKKALDYLDITPIEGLQLLNDPTLGPTIRGLMATFAKGGAGLLGGLGGGQPHDGGSLRRGNIPNMS